MKKFVSVILPYVAVLFICACASPQMADSRADFSVDGDLRSIGNEPFTQLVLTTDNQNSYVLVFKEGTAPASDLGRYSVTGRLYADDWNGTRHAFIDVAAIRKVE